MPDERIERERKFWDSFAARYDPFMRGLRPIYAAMVEFTDRWIEPEAAVLEIATGTGLVALDLAGKAAKVVGVDLSPAMVAIARRKAAEIGATNVEFSVQDAYALEFEPRTFDVVLTANVLHVLIEPERVLGEAQRVLKDDGLLIAATFCHGENVRSRTMSALMSLFGFRAFHKWSLESFGCFVADNGFRAVDSTVIPGVVPLEVVVARKIGA